MALKAIRVGLLVAGCFARCNQYYVLELQACPPDSARCQASAAIALDLCDEDCSQRQADRYLENDPFGLFPWRERD